MDGRLLKAKAPERGPVLVQQVAGPHRSGSVSAEEREMERCPRGVRSKDRASR